MPGGSPEYLPGWRVAGFQLGALKDCSLIIPTYSRPAEIASLLTRLISHEPDDLPAEVLVIDGSPDERTERELNRWRSKYSPVFTLVYVRTKPGLTLQKNIGIDLSSGQYLYFLDDDTAPELGYFREIRKAFAADQDRRVGAIGGAIVNEMDRPLSFRWRVRLALRLIPRAEPMRYDSCGASLPKSMIKPFAGVRTVDVVPGGASCFRREVFKDKRFSAFFAGYSNGEDVEMSLRTGRSFTLLLCGSAKINHYPAAGGRPPGFTRGRMDVRNRLFIRRRFWPSGKILSSLRFWADVALLITLDLALFCRCPRRTYLLLHATGLLFASFEALFRPPSFEEPIARCRYALQTELPISY